MGAGRSIAAMGIAAGIATSGSGALADASILAHAEVTGPDILAAEVRRAGGTWAPVAWGALAGTIVEPGHYEVREHAASTAAGDALQIPWCAGRTAVQLDSRLVGNTAGPLVVPVAPGPHELVIQIDVSRYERRIACGQPPRLGPVQQTKTGLGLLVFDSPYAARGGGRAVVYVPPGHDLNQTSAVLVGLHPWNGSMWTYAAYEELLGEARARGVLLLMPCGLGNSLYTADAEDEVLRAIDALGSAIPVSTSLDSASSLTVSIWGASMGGAGATTIAFHHPDRFAAATSFFGDSSYDLSTYVRSILVDERGAHRVNALDVVDNARNLPVWLIHGEDDTTSPIRQSAILADAMQQRAYAVRFDRVPGMGHAGVLVARFLRQVVAAAATAQTSVAPERVTYRSVRPSDVGAYGIGIERTSPTADAFIDLERRPDGLHVHHADGVREIDVAFGVMRAPCRQLPHVFFDDPASAVPVRSHASPCL